MARKDEATTADLPPYPQLKARAKELGINHVGIRGTELAKLIDVEEARIATETADKGEQATADVVAAANETPTGAKKTSAKEPAGHQVPTLEQIQAEGYTEQAARVIVAQEQQKADELAGKKPRSGKAVRIERQNATTWWCPIDDHSMPQYMQGCALCGARRDGDEVIPLKV